ncbi:MAG: hypothetical protein NXY57DRAFT_778455 [Lentinula lateritia]|nr:MAG: hypothetical protein NXY57DRAFT_778455 [Lentinula lateritia]
MIDVRMSMISLNELVGSLNDQIYEATPLNPTIRWGEETARLASTGAILTGLDMDTIPEPTLTKEEEFVPFLPPFVENIIGTHDVTVRLVELDSARTSALREKCRRNHITVTVAVDAIFALAHAEAVLLNAAAIGGAHYASTIDAYTKATQWFMPLSCKDQRPSWPTSSSIHHPEGTTLFGTDGFPLQTRMETIRKAVGFSVDTNSLNPCNEEFFWGVVAADMAAAHAAPRKDLAAYVQREREKQAMCKSFHPSSMMVRSPISSSIGHLDGLGLFAKYTPGSSSLTQVHRQYDGKLNCSLLAAAKWNSPAEMDGMEKALREWFDHVIEDTQMVE